MMAHQTYPIPAIIYTSFMYLNLNIYITKKSIVLINLFLRKEKMKPWFAAFLFVMLVLSSSFLEFTAADSSTSLRYINHSL